jgi:nucleoside-diphosphate-sugar epimerase
MTKLIVGCGYLGERVARRWRDRGEKVTVVTRSPDRAEILASRGYTSVIADVCRPESLQLLPTTDSVLYSVGFDAKAGRAMEDVYAGGVRNVLAALKPDVRRFIYISTTGVYGPADGGWVDELTPPDPRREGGRASLAAEQSIKAHALGPRAIILRLAGIYGPGRIPFLEQLSNSEPIPAPVDGHLNLIHVDDAAGAVVAADCLKTFDNGPRVYCVSDGNPVKRLDYYCEVARQIGAPRPVFVEPEPLSPRAIRAASDRRICNGRMLRELELKLRYPDYRSGLSAILETENQ